MRRCGIVTDEGAAHRFANYLLGQRIQTRLEQGPDGWSIWILDEDKLNECRDELVKFAANPNDPVYLQSAPSAEGVRKEWTDRDREFKKNYVEMRRVWDSRAAKGAPLTVIYIVACVVIAVLTGFAHDQTTPLLNDLRITQLYFLNGEVRADLTLPEIRDGEIWRLWTPMFIHFGIIHLAMNMFAIYQLSTAIEVRRGTFRLLVLILWTQLWTSLAQWYWGLWSGDLTFGFIPSEATPNFGGASGVAFGMFGYIWMKSRYDPYAGLYIDPAGVRYMLVFMLLCMFGLLGPIANAGHVGGLLSGMAMAVTRPMLRTWIRRRPSG